MSDAIIHLLIPKEFKVYCRPSKSAASMEITSRPLKATCVNCLNLFKRKKTGKRGRFKAWMVRGKEVTFQGPVDQIDP